MNYTNLSDKQKKEYILKNYKELGKSFSEIAKESGTYANKIRRDAIKLKIDIRDKSTAQKNALANGSAKHPTKGKQRSDTVKSKIGRSVMESWENLDDQTMQQRKEKARLNWEKLSEDTKASILKEANNAVRKTSKVGSKLEKYILNKLLKDNYRVDFHKEHSLLNTKLQIDLFLPQLNVAIEVDGPSHFKPVWGKEALNKNKKYDNKKTGLILGKGWALIRIIQNKDFSMAQAEKIYEKLKIKLDSIKNNFPDKDNRTLIIGDK